VLLAFDDGTLSPTWGFVGCSFVARTRFGQVWERTSDTPPYRYDFLLVVALECNASEARADSEPLSPYTGTNTFRRLQTSFGEVPGKSSRRQMQRVVRNASPRDCNLLRASFRRTVQNTWRPGSVAFGYGVPVVATFWVKPPKETGSWLAGLTPETQLWRKAHINCTSKSSCVREGAAAAACNFKPKSTVMPALSKTWVPVNMACVNGSAMNQIVVEALYRRGT
jgi:hypothetical protein